MNRAELKTRAKQMMKGNLGMLIVCMIIVGAVEGVANAVFAPVGVAVSACVTGPLLLGTAYVYLNIARGYTPSVKVLFSGFGRFVDALVLMILRSIFIFLWSLLFVIPGIIKAISYSQAFYVLAEHPEMGGKEALDESIAIMDGHKMEYFMLGISFIPWIFLIAVTFGIASFFVVPYMETTYTCFYLKVRRSGQTDENDTDQYNGSYQI